MKSLKLIIFILVILIKTGNNLSASNLFYVNNVEITKKTTSNTEILANEAIKKGFRELINKVLLQNDQKKLGDLDILQIKELISYYQIIDTKKKDDKDKNKVFFNIAFDQDKIHDLFFTKEILYSDVSYDELFILPILKKNDQLYIYNQNYFYDKWNFKSNDDFVEFILPIENIEVLQLLNSNYENLLSIQLKKIFTEYSDKNTALVLIEENNSEIEKIFLKTNIMGKDINKSLKIKKLNLNQDQYYEKIIRDVKNEIIGLVKSQNLIDIRTPSFINVKLLSSKKSNLVELNKRLNDIELIESIYVQELNNNYVNLKIKYLGKINKIISQLKSRNINLELKDEQWNVEILK